MDLPLYFKLGCLGIGCDNIIATGVHLSRFLFVVGTRKSNTQQTGSQLAVARIVGGRQSSRGVKRIQIKGQ